MMSAIGTHFAMGGYAVHVWPAYPLSTAVLGGFALFSWWRYRSSARSLDKLILPARFELLEESSDAFLEPRALPLVEAQLLTLQHMGEHATGAIAPAR
jgi:heme exporter protein CcmD